MNYTRPLKLARPRMTGQDILAVQTKLGAQGFYGGKNDGIYGPMTKAAVIAYQKSMNLKRDGVVGKITWGALMTVKVSAERCTFTEIANEQVENGSIYVLGSQGQPVEKITEHFIEQREHGVVKEINRVKKLLAARLKAGFVHLRAFDCSGLVLWCLEKIGFTISDHNANGIFYDLCVEIDRQDLICGDLVFKKYATSNRMYHVGIYMGDGTVVHCKGRDDGVVRESINATGWNRYGRIKVLG